MSLADEDRTRQSLPISDYRRQSGQFPHPRRYQGPKDKDEQNLFPSPKPNYLCYFVEAAGVSMRGSISARVAAL
jgi:hypothetical protein